MSKEKRKWKMPITWKAKKNQNNNTKQNKKINNNNIKTTCNQINGFFNHYPYPRPPPSFSSQFKIQEAKKQSKAYISLHILQISPSLSSPLLSQLSHSRSQFSHMWLWQPLASCIGANVYADFFANCALAIWQRKFWYLNHFWAPQKW